MGQAWRVCSAHLEPKHTQVSQNFAGAERPESEGRSGSAKVTALGAASSQNVGLACAAALLCYSHKPLWVEDRNVNPQNC